MVAEKRGPTFFLLYLSKQFLSVMRLVLKHIAKRLRLKNDFVVILRTILNEKEFRQDKIFKITRKKELKVFMI